MSRLALHTESSAEMTVESIYGDMERRIMASPRGACPVDLTSAFLKVAMTQTCGKCTPCRVGLVQLSNMLDDVMNNQATMETLDKISLLAHSIADSADCAIGIESARMVIKSLDGAREDYESHIKLHRCSDTYRHSIPCVANCPAQVDIPGYIALVHEKRYEDAVRLIRKDNPFVMACALICEHPCESHCRRTMLDAPVNIRAMKRTAVDRAGVVPAPKCEASTGKRVAIVGGGPSGLSAAYYLQLMGHQCTVFEKHDQLGGMLVYGIPSYRLPRERLQEDIDCILSTGVEVRTGINIGAEGQPAVEDLRSEYDAVYISIGAHTDKKVGLEGEEDAIGIISAVDYLGSIGDNIHMDFTGKRVCVIGGGNVAMDCTRSAIRHGAESVSIVYRRRQVDMTALQEEVEDAIAEGAIMRPLCAPVRIETDENNNVTALWVSPKMPSLVKRGRVSPADTDKPEERIPCDVVLVAVGQGIDSNALETAGIPITHGVVAAEDYTAVENVPGIFAGGDCVTGPKTAIRAIAAGKVAAANIDNYLGYYHTITSYVDIPTPHAPNHDYCGRVNAQNRIPAERIKDFDLIEMLLTEQESHQESGRCLRCDHYGCGAFKGGRNVAW